MALKVLLIALILSFECFGAPKKVRKKIRPKPVSAKGFFLGNLNYIWWQEIVQITTPDGRTYGIDANAHGPCAGLGYLYRTRNWDFTFTGCGMFGVTDIGSPAVYAQKGIETMAVIAGPSALWRPSVQTSIGLGVPAVYRVTDWQIPQGWKVEPQSAMAFGVVLDAQWRTNRVVINQKFGQVFDLGWLWSLGFTYIF